MGTGLVWRPPRLVEGKTHFGSMSNFVHDSMVFSEATTLRQLERTRAKLDFALAGIKRKVGHRSSHTSRSDGSWSVTELVVGELVASTCKLGPEEIHWFSEGLESAREL